MALNWTLVGYGIGGVAVIAAAVIGWFARRPSDEAERSKQIQDGAWRLKDEAERARERSEARLAVVEGQVRENTAALAAARAGFEAEKLAQRTLHKAQIEAQATLHAAEMLAKDKIIVRLTEKIDTLERRLDAIAAERRGTADALPLQVTATVSRGDATSD